MSQHEMIPFRRIIEMVREFCTQRRTGTVFIVSDDNRMAQVHLESGNIVALLCRGLHTGRKRWPKHAHHAGGPPALRRQLPDRQRCRALRHQCRARPAGRRRGGRCARPNGRRPPRPRAGPISGGGRDRLSAQAAALEQILVQYVGPMAEILCADHVAQAANLLKP
ncbi:hypothetical protein LP420_35380 [Massilia sp. B-10]|nr:hypothetical protein LP420_35380 [Massilia sp. B-10]